MQQPGRLLFVWIFFFLASVWYEGTAATAETLKIGGTGGDLGTMRILGDAFEKANSSVKVSVLKSLGSGGGISAVIDGAIDVAISSRPPKEGEREAGVESLPYARTAIALATNSTQLIEDFKYANLVSFYARQDRRWHDGSAIRLVLRPNNDGDSKLLYAKIPGLEEAAGAARKRGSPLGMTDQDAADLLEKVQGSLGFLSLSVILGEHRDLRFLPINGVYPSETTLANGSYPLSKTFFAITGPKRNLHAQHFIEFLGSSIGSTILRETGHVPITATK